MLKKILILREEIEEELTNIDNLKDNLQQIQNRDLEQNLKTRLSASILDDFYLAVEKIFKKIAGEIDEDIPEGSEWHKKLLRLMTIDLSGNRPAVIDKDLFHQLEKYLKFRHLVRNIYGFQLNIGRFEHLIEELEQTVVQLNTQITEFLNSMEQIAEESDNT